MFNVGKTGTINLKTKKHEEKIPKGLLGMIEYFIRTLD